MDLRVIDLHGTPRDMGRQHGERLSDQARAMAQTRLDLCLKAAREINPALDMDWCLALADRCMPFLRRYAFEVYEECQGVAEGAGLTMPQMVIGNGYTDYIDVLMLSLEEGAGCTSFIATGEATADGLSYVGQTWDMHAFAEPHMRLFRRRPDDGPAWLTLTTAGCLSLIGLSEAGIAIGNTNVVPTDARPGVIYLAMIHQALRSPDFESACAAITAAPRASGHYYYLAGPEGTALGIETTATRHAHLAIANGLLVHANHYHDAGLAGMAREPASENSQARELALRSHLLPRLGEITLEDLMAGLRLRESEHPLCRPSAEPEEVTTCAAAIMCPERRAMWVALGNPRTTDFEEVSL